MFVLVGIIPQSWRRYTVPQGITVIQWITDFSLRVKQLQAIVQTTQQGGTKELKVCYIPSHWIIHVYSTCSIPKLQYFNVIHKLKMEAMNGIYSETF
jgi:hypothetical protein